MTKLGSNVIFRELLSRHHLEFNSNLSYRNGVCVIDGRSTLKSRELNDDELVEALRRAASAWFKNDDLLLLEELIRRYRLKVLLEQLKEKEKLNES